MNRCPDSVSESSCWNGWLLFWAVFAVVLVVGGLFASAGVRSLSASLPWFLCLLFRCNLGDCRLDSTGRPPDLAR